MKKRILMTILAAVLFSAGTVCFAANNSELISIVAKYKEICLMGQATNDNLKAGTEDMLALLGRKMSYDFVIKLQKDWNILLGKAEAQLKKSKELLNNFPFDADETTQIKVLDEVAIGIESTAAIHIVLLQACDNINRMAAEEIDDFYLQLQKLLEEKRRKGI